MADPDAGDLLLVAASDQRALQRILKRWLRPVWTLFERLEEPSSASESAIEVFVELYRTAPRYGPETPFSPWLFGIVGRLLQARPQERLASIPPARLRASSAARAALVRSAVLALRPQERAVLLLIRRARLTVPSTATALDVSETEIRRLLLKAMDGLRASLEALLELPVAASQAALPAASQDIPPAGPLGNTS